MANKKERKVTGMTKAELKRLNRYKRIMQEGNAQG
jgi:hypothetical protein